MQLQSILRVDKYQELLGVQISLPLSSDCFASSYFLQALASFPFIFRGPPTKRRYFAGASSSSSSSVPVSSSPVEQFQSYLLSADFSKTVETITGLEVTSGHCEVRRFDPGCYTIFHDQDPERKQVGLDVVFWLVPKEAGEWNEEHGGTTHYLIEGEDEELLTVVPAGNSASLVYRAEPGCMRFVHYVNSLAKQPLYEFSCVFRVKNDGDDDDDDDGDEDEDEEGIQELDGGSGGRQRARKDSDVEMKQS